MRFIPTRVHGLLDYFIAIILLGLPYLSDAWVGGGPKVWVPMTLGIAAIIYSLLTAYELGLVGLLPMPMHLLLDAVSGVALAISPFLLGFAGRVWAPYVVLGVIEIATSLMTRTTAGTLSELKKA